MIGEYSSSAKHDVWEMVPNPTRKSKLEMYAIDGSIEMSKAAFVGRGFSQEDKTFAPFARGFEIHEQDTQGLRIADILTKP
jgi:hypothetical protein